MPGTVRPSALRTPRRRPRRWRRFHSGARSFHSRLATCDDFACSSATSCFAIGTDFTGGFPTRTAVVVPITGGIAGPPQPVPGARVLSHVSCPSATSCFATGLTDGVQGVFVAITNGVPGPAQVVAGADYLNDIACPSPSTCVIAGGLTFQSVGGFVVAVTDGTAGPAQLISPNVDLYSVACTDASHCVAVGDANIPGVGFAGVVVAIDDGVAGPYQAVPGTGILTSVACSTSCVAVGADSSFNFDALVPISGGVPGSAQYAGGAGPPLPKNAVQEAGRRPLSRLGRQAHP
jgi:hypothetical protein